MKPREYSEYSGKPRDESTSCRVSMSIHTRFGTMAMVWPRDSQRIICLACICRWWFSFARVALTENKEKRKKKNGGGGGASFTLRAAPAMGPRHRPHLLKCLSCIADKLSGVFHEGKARDQGAKSI